MSVKQIIGTAIAVAIGTTIALAIAGLYLKSQLSATAGNSTIGTILSLFGSRPAGST